MCDRVRLNVSEGVRAGVMVGEYVNETVAECVGWERVSDVVGPEAVRDSVRENDAERVGAGVIVAVPRVRLNDTEKVAERVTAGVIVGVSEAL